MANLTNAGVFSSETDTWETPDDVFAPLHAEFGFDLDAAASDDNAKCERYFTPADDALAQDWTGTVWCNPPYGRQIGRWVEKGYVEAQAGATVVMLIPARTDTAYWHDFVMKANEVRFRRGRIYFEMNGKPVGRAPFPSAVIVFRNALEADDGA